MEVVVRALLNLATQAKIISKLGMPGERQRETERDRETERQSCHLD